MNTHTLNFEGYWFKPYINNLPASSGIYCVYAYFISNNDYIIRRLLYIGEAENIHSRVFGHERWSDWERERWNDEELCFNAAPVSLASDRKRIEVAMINYHKPPCNLKYVNLFLSNPTPISTTGKNALLKTSYIV